MANLKYGTPEYYAEHFFSDWLADVDADRPDTVDNIIEGFYQALNSWFEYHDAQAKAYATMRERVRKALSV